MGAAVTAEDFVSLDTSAAPGRTENGGIDMHGLLLLTDAARSELGAGARGHAWGQQEATVWVVGDSTVSAFNDSYYLPREGYGEALASYFNANVYNLARSGASSKDFTGMAQYDTLLNGSGAVPALGDAETENFLIIGFGHNDQKTEPARFTDPNGDYRTEGSFANSLYVNYIRPALDRGVIPVVCTPIARLTKANTAESYESASGHVTSDVTIGDTLYPGGDYAKAILDMVRELQAEGIEIEVIDLTAATIRENIALGENAQWLHSFTGAKRAEDGTLVPTGLDQTHTNSYGARFSAWLISELAAETAPRLNAYSLHKDKPTYDQYFAAAVNPDYVPLDYKSPTEAEMDAAMLPAYTDADGRVWHGTGFLFYYTRLPAGTRFTLTADATIGSFAGNNQVSFGLMARDDLYIDTYVAATMGDYVVAGSRNQGAIVNFGRKSGGLVGDAPKAAIDLGEGAKAALALTGSADGFTLSYGGETASAGFDYPLTAVDADWIYVGFYTVRNCSVTFSNVHLVIEE